MEQAKPNLNEQREFNRSEVDIDVVLELMKYKYGYGDLASGWIEEFEEELDNETLFTINPIEYAYLLDRFIQKDIRRQYTTEIKLKINIMKIFYIIEARDPDTRHLEHRRVYTTEEQYLIRGMKQVEKFNELYDVKVTKYICNESVEVLNLKADELPPTETDVIEINESDIERIVKKVITDIRK